MLRAATSTPWHTAATGLPREKNSTTERWTTGLSR